MAKKPNSPIDTSLSPEPGDVVPHDNTDAGQDQETQASAKPPSDESTTTTPWIRNK
jgi:hypothetical protein